MVKLSMTQTSQIVLFITLSCLVKISQAQCAKFITNLNFLGQTYNIFRGNPHTTQGTDPGFTNFNVFDFKYPNDPSVSNSAGSPFFIPNGVKAIKVKSKSLGLTSNLITTIKEYTDSIRKNISLKDSLEFAPFCASEDFQRVKSGLSQDQVYYEYYNSEYETQISLLSDDNLIINNEFIELMQELLDAGEDESAYHMIFNSIGTHVSEQVILGSLFGYHFQFEKDFKKTNPQELPNEIDEVANRLMESSSYYESNYINQNEAFINWRSFSAGKPIFFNSKSQINYQFDNQMPIDIKLISLQEFLSKYGKTIPNKDTIILRMNKYFKTYCYYLLTSSSKDPSSCDL